MNHTPLNRALSMDVLPRITGQFIDRFREMTLFQRAASIALVLVVALGFAALFMFQGRMDFQPVSFGKAFDREELASAERALITAGLTAFRRDGQRLMAPERDLVRYNAALLEFDALPADLGSQMLKQYESLGPFSTDRQRQQMKEALLLQELRRMIKAVPDIEEARVAVASSERKLGWNQKPRATANVTITPRAGREVSATLVNALRHVVASMVPDLQPADVTIFDVTRGQAYTGETIDETTESRSSNRVREMTRLYEQQLLKALSHIPDVSVVVQVDYNILKSSVARMESTRRQGEISPVANRPAAIDDPDNHVTGFRGTAGDMTDSTGESYDQKMLRALPNAVQISVSIPRDYLREIATRSSSKGEQSSNRRDLGAIEDDVIAKVERIVARLIPNDSANNAISVTCVDRLDGAVADKSSPYTKGATFDQYFQWGGAITLIALAVLGMGMLTRTKKSSPETDHSADLQKFETSAVDDSPPPPRLKIGGTSLDRAAMLREEIRTLVQSDPAASAELLGRWLTEAPQ